MKTYKSISLIETLISLTIVGISIVALMPVMTVKKDVDNQTKGNRFWNSSPSMQDARPSNVGLDGIDNGNPIETISPSLQKIIIGSDTEPNNPLVVYSKGFGNSSIVPLYAERLLFIGQTVEQANTNILNINANNKARNLYINQNSVIIDNNPNTVISNNGANVTHNAIDIESNAICSISSSSGEWINIDEQDKTISIGKNAGKKFNHTVEAENTTINSIIIGNLPNDPSVSDSKETLLIGNTTTSDVTPGSFVIEKYEASTAIGINANINISNGYIQANAYFIPSDKNLKNVVGPYNKGLKEIKKVKPVEFTYKNDKNQIHHIGVIAQDLQKVFPESVSKNQETGYLSINTDATFYALLNSIKELDNKNKIIEKRNKDLEQKVLELRKIRDNLKAQRGGQHE